MYNHCLILDTEFQGFDVKGRIVNRNNPNGLFSYSSLLVTFPDTLRKCLTMNSRSCETPRPSQRPRDPPGLRTVKNVEGRVVRPLYNNLGVQGEYLGTAATEVINNLGGDTCINVS